MHFGKYFRNLCQIMLFFLIWIVGCLRILKWYKTWFHDFAIQNYCTFTAAYLFLYTGRLDCCGANRRRQCPSRYFLKKLFKSARIARPLNIRILSLDFSEVKTSWKGLDVFWTSLFWCQEHTEKLINLNLTFFNENVRK